jgi:hypothetical protein
MHQQEFKFFWPLTEQIPLDLDYSNCVKLKNCTINQNNGIISLSTGHTWTTSAMTLTANKIETTIGIETPGLTMKSKKKPNVVRRALYSILGIKWRIDDSI